MLDDYTHDDFGLQLDETVYVLDELIPEHSSIYDMDRTYLDFERLYKLHADLPLLYTQNIIQYETASPVLSASR